MVDVFIYAWMGSVRSREEKVSLDRGSLWTQGGTLVEGNMRLDRLSVREASCLVGSRQQPFAVDCLG
jgi:hypothetical protein